MSHNSDWHNCLNCAEYRINPEMRRLVNSITTHRNKPYIKVPMLFSTYYHPESSSSNDVNVARMEALRTTLQQMDKIV